jgi:predicted phosphodiesterase
MPLWSLPGCVTLIVMKVAVISDVHGNLEALRAVWSDLSACEAEEVYCLGDSVGYGPDPEAVLAFLRHNKVQSVMGNHELGLVDPVYMDWFNPQARKSLKRTKKLLSPDSLDYIATLPPVLVAHGLRMVHGLPPQSVTTYLFEVANGRLAAEMAAMEEHVCFVGHTHELVLVRVAGGEVKHLALGQDREILDAEQDWIVNIGSVGQPRDGDFSAKYALFDTTTRELQIRYVEYDPTETKRKIMDRGLGEVYALRLG